MNSGNNLKSRRTQKTNRKITARLLVAFPSAFLDKMSTASENPAGNLYLDGNLYQKLRYAF